MGFSRQEYWSGLPFSSWLCTGNTGKKTQREIGTEAEYEDLKSNLAKDAWIKGDSASGFVVKGYGGKRELIIKFYMQGMGGHADTLGYCLMHLTLNSDDTWNQERSEFVLDM